MITINLWRNIINFIEDTTKEIKTAGILICGSLVRNELRNGSDIDILFLNKEIDFKMETLYYNKILFDKMIATPKLLLDILKQNSELSDILTLSFGSANQIIEDSEELRNIIFISKQNIESKELKYHKDEDKPAHISNQVFKIDNINGEYKLICNGKIIV